MTRSSLARLVNRAIALGYVGEHDPIGAAAYVRGYLHGRNSNRRAAQGKRQLGIA